MSVVKKIKDSTKTLNAIENNIIDKSEKIIRGSNDNEIEENDIISLIKKSSSIDFKEVGLKRYNSENTLTESESSSILNPPLKELDDEVKSQISEKTLVEDKDYESEESLEISDSSSDIYQDALDGSEVKSQISEKTLSKSNFHEVSILKNVLEIDSDELSKLDYRDFCVIREIIALGYDEQLEKTHKNVISEADKNIKNIKRQKNVNMVRRIKDVQNAINNHQVLGKSSIKEKLEILDKTINEVGNLREESNIINVLDSYIENIKDNPKQNNRKVLIKVVNNITNGKLGKSVGKDSNYNKILETYEKRKKLNEKTEEKLLYNEVIEIYKYQKENLEKLEEEYLKIVLKLEDINDEDLKVYLDDYFISSIRFQERLDELSYMSIICDKLNNLNLIEGKEKIGSRILNLFQNQLEDIKNEIKESEISIREDIECIADFPNQKILKEDKNKASDDIFLTDGVWSIVNYGIKLYSQICEISRVGKKMTTSDRLLFEKMLTKKNNEYLKNKTSKIKNDVKSNNFKKLLDLLRVIKRYYLGGDSLIREIKKDVKRYRIKNRNTSREIIKVLNQQVKNGVITKEEKKLYLEKLKQLFKDIKDKKLYGGYYYVSFPKIDGKKEMFYKHYGDEDVKIFDLNNPLTKKETKEYYLDIELDKERVCDSSSVKQKLVQELTSKYGLGGLETRSLIKDWNIEDNKQYYVTFQDKQEIPEMQTVFCREIESKKGRVNIRVYELENPLDFDVDNKVFKYNGENIDKSRLYTVKQDKNFERMMFKLDEAKSAKKYFNYYMKYSEEALNLMRYIHQRKNNTEWDKEENVMKNLLGKIQETKNAMKDVEESQKKMENILDEYVKLKETEGLKNVENLKIKDAYKELHKSINLFMEKMDGLLSYKEGVEKDHLQIKINEKSFVKAKRAKGIRRIAEDAMFLVLGVNGKNGVINGVTQYVSDIMTSDWRIFKEQVLENAKKRDANNTKNNELHASKSDKKVNLPTT